MTPKELARFRTIISQSAFDQLKRIESKLDMAIQVLATTGLTDTQVQLGTLLEEVRAKLDAIKREHDETWSLLYSATAAAKQAKLGKLG